MIKPPRISLVLACCVFFLTDCSKKETMEVDNETQSVVDYAIADQEFLAMGSAAFQSILQTKGLGTANTASCDTLSYLSGDTTDFLPNPVYALNVSGSSCSRVMPDGKVRSGKLMIRLTGNYKTAGTQIIIKPTGYLASGNTYGCDSIVLTTVTYSTNSTTFQTKLINGSCSTGTATIKCASDITTTLYPNGNPSGSEAITYVYGKTSGTNRFGKRFETNTLAGTPLVKYKNCQYIVKGLMELTPEGFKTRTVDFGDGVCDDGASFTVNENRVAFKLK